jgi:predicted Zn-dependent peptidase
VAARQAPPPAYEEAPAPAYEAPAPAGAPDYAAELEQLAALKQKGILTEEEFEAKKKQILGL